MKKFKVLIFAAALVIGLVVANIFSFGKSDGRFFNFSFNFKGVRGSGQTATDARNVSGFKAVDVGGVFKVEITAQKDFSVEVDADDNLLQYVKTDVRGGTLHIETEKKLSPKSPIIVRVSAPDLDHLDISGVADVTVSNIRNESVSLDSSGASKVSINGETKKFTADVSGATKIDAENLATVDATVDASGASTVTVNTTGSLKGNASGASKIFYVGSPASVKKDTSGASKITQK